MALADNKEKIRTLLNGINNLPNAGGGGNATWAGLPDKPVVMEGTPDTLTWDGNTDGKVSSAEGVYKVSNAVPTLNDFSNGLIAIVQGTEVKVTASEVGEMLHEGVVAGGGFFIVPAEIAGTDWSGMVFPEAGTYFVEGICSSLTIPGYTGFAQEKIAPSHLWQPDWNQNDSTQPDFIKNRPFGTRIVNLIPETEIVGVEEGGIFSALLAMNGYEAGAQMRVVFDDDEYICDMVFADEGTEYYGNLSIAEPSFSDTGEPFIMIAVGNGLMFGMQDGAAHKITIDMVEVNKLHDMYYDKFTKFYIVLGDVYLYSNVGLEKKATADEVIVAAKKGPIILVYAGGAGATECFYTPLAVVRDNTEYVLITIALGATLQTLHTAEYEPPTT